MYRLDIAPLSANRLWTGRRFPTQEYKKYREKLLYLLPKIQLPQAPYHLIMEVGMSNKRQDLDNITKGFWDALGLKLGFDDSKVVGDAGEYQVQAIDGMNNMLYLTIPRNNWHKIEKVRFICLHDAK